MAVPLSTNAVKLYSPVTGQYYGECRGHSATINHISCSGASAPHVLHSCSSDGTIRAWDTRSFQQVAPLVSLCICIMCIIMVMCYFNFCTGFGSKFI
jgi:WD40 repeat protein